VSLPLLGFDGVVGALNVYAYAKDAFAERAIELGELFAVPAAISVQTAQELDAARRLTAQLETALTSREVIDHAVGIVMSRTGCTAGEAFDKLRLISQTEDRKLAQVAHQVRDDAVRRARARHAGG
jgi:AmiR/NasT family two-component response regulator